MKLIDGKEIFTISEINQSAKSRLEEIIIWIEGEVSSVQTDPKWFNAFINLKDGSDLLTCFTEITRFRSFPHIKVGDKVYVYGNLTLFKKNEYKFKIAALKIAGDGILQKNFKELYEKLQREGLFLETHKKEIPIYPTKVCIVSSKGSAGWNDFKTMSVDKFPIVELSTLDISVGGPKAIGELTTFLPVVDKHGFDVIVITRGGGSEESLMEVFNDEQVVRTIFKLKTPKIVAIGHEINVSLSELVADKRASTPTDAANIIISGYSKILEKLENLNYRLKSKIQQFEVFFQKLDFISSRLMDKKKEFLQLNIVIENFKSKFESSAKNILKNNTVNLENLSKSLSLLSPENTLKRGYSLTFDSSGNILRSIEAVEVLSSVRVKLHDGSFKAKVKSKQKNV